MGVIDPNGKAGLKLASEVLMLLHGGDETLKGVNRAGTASVTAWVEGAIDLQGVKAATSHEANSSRKPNLPGFGGSEPLKESIAKTSTAISELRGKIETLSRAKDLIDAMNNDAILMLHEATSGSIRGDWKFDKENLRSIGNDLGAAVSNYGKQLKVMEKQLDGLQKLDKMMSPISSPQEPQRQNLPRNKPDAGGVRG
jgi:hypothetical protein